MQRRFILASALFAIAVTASAQHGGGGDLAKEKKVLATAKAAYVTAKGAYTKKPSDAKLKKAYVVATVKFATATMTSGALSSKEKYPGALRLYREALKVDPKNKEALQNKQMIEQIYQSMGKPIPK